MTKRLGRNQLMINPLDLTGGQPAAMGSPATILMSAVGHALPRFRSGDVQDEYQGTLAVPADTASVVALSAFGLKQ